MLLDQYAWYEEVESDLAVLLRDAGGAGEHSEALAEEADMTAAMVDPAARGWPRRKAVRAAIAHAIEFETWLSLVCRQGLSRKQAVDAMLRFVEAVSEAPRARAAAAR
jgi:hypothetical protein